MYAHSKDLHRGAALGKIMNERAHHPLQDHKKRDRVGALFLPCINSEVGIIVPSEKQTNNSRKSSIHHGTSLLMHIY